MSRNRDRVGLTRDMYKALMDLVTADQWDNLLLVKLTTCVLVGLSSAFCDHVPAAKTRNGPLHAPGISAQSVFFDTEDIWVPDQVHTGYTESLVAQCVCIKYHRFSSRELTGPQAPVAGMKPSKLSA